MKEWIWDTANKTRMGEYITCREVGFINKYVNNKPIRSVLDIGGGSGRIVKHIPGRDEKQIVVLDQGVQQLKQAEINLNCRICQGDASHLPFQANSFDLVLAIQLIEYLPNLDSFLHECHRVLKTDGSLIMTWSNRNSPFGRLYPFFFKKNPIFYRFSCAEGVKRINRSQFKIETLKGYRWLPFNRASNSQVIPVLSRLESWFTPITGNPRISPWIFCAAIKEQFPEK